LVPADLEIGIEEQEKKQWQKCQNKKKKEISQHELRDVDVDGAQKIKDLKEDQQKNIEYALGVDVAGMRESRGVDWIIAFVNLAFMLVVVGCEIDLYGFAFSWQEYWNQEIVIVRALLVICPIGYFLAVAMYMHYNTKKDEKIDQSPQDARRTPGGVNSRGSRSQTPPDPEQTPVLRRESISIRFYHFIPIFRYYVVVKDKEADDVEAIFRVNSLSSFSLGIAQMVGLLFHMAVLQQPLTVFHTINIVSQVVNWSITLLYVGTSVAGYMKAVIKVDAMKYNDTEYLRQQQEIFADLQKKAANPSDTAAGNKLEEFFATMDNLILGLGNGNCLSRESLRSLSPDWKFRVLKLLFQKKVARYAKA